MLIRITETPISAKTILNYPTIMKKLIILHMPY